VTTLNEGAAYDSGMAFTREVRSKINPTLSALSKILLKCLYSGFSFPSLAKLDMLVYRYMLFGDKIQLTLGDLDGIYPEKARQLRKLLNTEGAASQGLEFTPVLIQVSCENKTFESNGSQGGLSGAELYQFIEREKIAAGTTVTDGNKHVYVQLLVYFLLITCRPQLKAFCISTFYEPREMGQLNSYLRLLTPEDVFQLLAGGLTCSRDALLESLDFGTMELWQEWFKDLLTELESQQLRNLCHWMTGRVGLPVGGFFDFESGSQSIPVKPGEELRSLFWTEGDSPQFGLTIPDSIQSYDALKEHFLEVLQRHSQIHQQS
jgi:hypothetical protein